MDGTEQAKKRGGTDNARICRAFGDVTRQRIFRLVLREELNVTELVDILRQPQSTISRQLKVLKSVGLIVDRRDGATTFYRALATASDSGQITAALLSYFESNPLEAALENRLQRVLRQREKTDGNIFERLGRRWDEMRTAAFGDVFAPEAFMALLPQAWTVADLGTGTGYLLPTLADRFRDVIAIDPSPTMLQCAEQRIAEHGARNVTFLPGDLNKLPIGSGTVDLALAFLVLHHVEQPDTALSEIARILRPKGRLLIVEQHAHENQSFYERMHDRWWGFDPADLARQAAQAGFADVRHHGLSKNPSGARDLDAPELFVMTGVRN